MRLKMAAMGLKKLMKLLMEELLLLVGVRRLLLILRRVRSAQHIGKSELSKRQARGEDLGKTTLEKRTCSFTAFLLPKTNQPPTRPAIKVSQDFSLPPFATLLCMRRTVL